MRESESTTMNVEVVQLSGQEHVSARSCLNQRLGLALLF